MAQDNFEQWRQHLETETRSGTRHREGLDQVRSPALTILAHADPGRVGHRVALAALTSGRSMPLSRLEPGFEPPTGGDKMPLADPRLSRSPVVFAPGPEGAVRIDCSAVSTRVHVAGTLVDSEVEISRDRMDAGVTLLLGERVALLLHLLEPPIQRGLDFGLVGESSPMVQLRREIQRVADLPFPVLLRGESGTGKELVARAIHDAGPRRSKTYLSVNVAAIPPTLAASELFGAVKGAYTGAQQAREGFFQRAHGGTLFLDEIGEAPPEVQVMLLRAVESQEVQPVGAATAQQVNVRLVCATDADLEAAVASGEFRSPLLHRLAGYEIALPPLRHRRDDIARLLYHFLGQELETVGEARRLADPGPHGRPWIPAELVSRLVASHWPGNVRQLKNVARQLVVASRGEREVVVNSKVEQMLRRETGIDEPAKEAPPVEHNMPEEPPSPSRPVYRKPSEVGDEELLAALRAEQWNLKQAAERLGVSRTTLYALIDECPQVRKASDIDREEIEQALRDQGGDLDAMVDRLEVSKRGLVMRMKELGLR